MRDTLVDVLSSEAASPLQKYRELYVGGEAFIDLLKYELLTSFLAPLPGALGFVLRKVLYGKLLASIGQGVVIGSQVTLRCPGRIHVGNHVFIDNNVVLDAKGEDSRIHLGDAVLVGRNSVISCASATIDLGADVSIGPTCCIRAGLGPVKLGSSITIGAHSVIISGNPSYELLDVPMKRQIGSTKGVSIGNDVWIGVGARIVDGVTIGNGCVVGAGAVVIQDVPDKTIVAGVPAEVIGRRDDPGDSVTEHERG